MSRTQRIVPAGVSSVGGDGTQRRLIGSGPPAGQLVPSPNRERVAFIVGLATPTLYVARGDGRERVKIGTGGMPSWSPDGSELVFRRSSGGLSVASADGGDIRSLGVVALGQAWSPSGEWIAFYSSSTTLELIRPDGSERKVVADDAYWDREMFPLGWSPDGKWLVFASVNQDTHVVEVNVARPDGSGRRSFGNGRSMVWAPDRDVFAFESDANGLEVVAPDGSVSLARRDLGGTPVWSPDGRRLAVGGVVIDVATGDLERTPLKGVVALAWSPDGTQLAGVPNRKSELLVASIGASRFRVAARGAVWRTPVWLDDDRIVFASKPLARGVVEATVEGGRPRMLLRGPTSYTLDRPAGSFSALAWSPDGHRLAVVQTFGRRYRVDVATFPGHGSRAVAVGATGVPSWSPDSRSLVFETAAGLRTVDVDGGHTNRLTRSHDEEPVWSPSGTQIAFQRPDGSGSEYALYVVDRDGRHVKALAHDVGSYPVWSPDGRRLAFAVGSDYEPTAIVTIRSDGTGRRRLASAPAAEDNGDVLRGPVLWSPDGRWILYYDEEYICGSKCSEISLLAIRPNGKDRHVVRIDVGAFAWSPDGGQLLGFDREGRLTAVDFRSRAIRFKGGFVDGVSWQPRILG